MTIQHEPIRLADVAAFFGCASDKFGQIAAVLDVLRRHVSPHDDMFKLADMARDVAMDYENMADCWREQVKKGGVRS